MNKSRLKIGVDIDGVLIDTDVMAYFKFLEKEYGWKINYELFAKTHSWYDATGQNSSKLLVNAFNKFLQKVEESQKPIEGAHDALKKISEVADIFLITARAGELKKVTEEFINDHLKDVRYHEMSMDNFKGKVSKVLDFSLDFFIDDSFNEISLIVENKEINTKLIPFPAFHSMPNWDDLQDERIHWLSVWEEINHDLDVIKQTGIHRKAWQEISEVIR